MISDKLPLTTIKVEGIPYGGSTKVTVYMQYFTVEHIDNANILRSRFNIEPGKLSTPEQYLFAFFLPYIFCEGILYDPELGFYK